MKNLVLTLLLFLFSGCTVLRQTGDGLCEAQDTISEVTHDAGGFFGPIGAGAATVLTTIVGFVCDITSDVLAAPDDLLTPADEEADTDAETDPGDGADLVDGTTSS